LWTCISSSAYLAGENLSQILHLLDNLPGKANGLFSTGENLVCSITCDNMEFKLPTIVPLIHLHEDSCVPATVESVAFSPANSMPLIPGVLPGALPSFASSWWV
ncbi:hypothetical protein DSO57_1025146, partial [Entomophthora muscae]